MKKRFLPISLLLTIIILAQSSFVANANGDSGKYNPRTTIQPTAHSFMKSIRANQETGLIDPAWLLQCNDNASQSRDGELDWTSLGPDNYGSLTRGIIYDNNDATGNTIYIGTMGGGIFKSVNGGITWQTVDSETNLMVTSMAQAVNGTIYIGTGDGRSAHNVNGMSVLNYENSFVGSGLYKLTDAGIERMNGTSDWAFINEVATYENNVYVATEVGIMMTTDGSTWSTLLEGEAFSVKTANDGSIMAVVGNDVYMAMSANDDFICVTDGTLLPSESTHKIIAVSPTDPNYAYISYLKTNNGTGNIYVTKNHGETWETAYISTNMYDIYGTRGLIDNAMAVYPNDPNKVLIGGLNLWVLRDETGTGIYRLECLSNGNAFQVPNSGGTYYYNYSYIHTGIQSIAFNPNTASEFFVGSEGGVFKGSYSTANGYLFEGANRYYIDEDNHTSVTRMFSVAFSGDDNMTLGGCLDHGTINVFGDPNSNGIATGNSIFPNDHTITDASTTYGPFDFTKAGGPCAISSIDPNIMIITTTGSHNVGTMYGTPIFRTQTAGDDYDKDNFSYSATEGSDIISNQDAFRTPIALFENYNDTKSIDYVKFYAKRNYEANETIQVRSDNAGFPFDYTLTESLSAGDSIEIVDIISSTLLVGVKNKVYMTRDALKFDQVANWWTIGNITGIPTAISISKDGDVAYVGTVAGKLYKFSGLTDAVTADLALGVDAIPGFDGSDSIPAVESVITFDTLAEEPFNGQAITSISIDPRDTDNVLVTLGNYGNDNYVLYSNDGGATFTSKQGNLPKIPVYSSVIEKETGVVMLGTESGIYTSSNMSTWTSDNALANIPVMDLKQQLNVSRDTRYVYLLDEVGDTTVITYPGIFNEGMIYAATYGRGLYRCSTYEVDGNEISVDENTFVQTLDMSIYPNPVINNANINFNIEEKANVSYQIYDLTGRMVDSAILGSYGQGSHNVTINVEGLASGTYIIKVQAGTSTNTSKFLVY